MAFTLSNRVKAVKPSPTLAVTTRAAELRAAGRDVIGLGAGEPDFDTPEHIKEAAIKAIHQGQTKYTAVDGTRELKQAVVDKFRRDNGLEYGLEQILVSCGGKHSFFNLAQAFLNPGDEVLIPAPYWVSYPDMTLLADGVPVFINADASQGFKITPQQLEASITDRTRMFVINSPSNPTGMAYSRAELAALGEVLLEHPRILVVTDDMYEEILWCEEPFSNIVNACPELIDRSMVLNGVSKAYSMTGWRIGYAAGPADLIKAMKKIQSQSTSNPASISQAAAVAALNGPKDCIAEMLKAFRMRHDHVAKRLNAMDGVECLEADGTFYLFPGLHAVIQRLDGVQNDVQLAEYLLDKVGVALVPGSAFGMPGHVRISIATGMDTLNAAMDRLEQAIAG